MQELASGAQQAPLEQVKLLQHSLSCVQPLPEPLPPIGELAEVTVALPTLPAAPVIPNGALKRTNDKNGRNGVWIVQNKSLTFAPVRVGAADLDGQVQILEGIKEGDQVVVYSQRELTKHSRVKIVDHLIKDTP